MSRYSSVSGGGERGEGGGERGGEGRGREITVCTTCVIMGESKRMLCVEKMIGSWFKETISFNCGTFTPRWKVL